MMQMFFVNASGRCPEFPVSAMGMTKDTKDTNDSRLEDGK